MISFLEGLLDEKHPTRVLLNVGGVGYEIAIPLSSYDRLPAPGESCRILTHLVIRDDAHLLFGFTHEKERAMFLKLVAVNGVGPRIALATLSGMNPRDLVNAILEGDVKRLTSIPGIGKKMAERLCVELKDKIDEADALEARSTVPGGAVPSDGKLADAILALVGLGYKQIDAAKRVEAVAQSTDTSAMSVEEILRTALGS